MNAFRQDPLATNRRPRDKSLTFFPRDDDYVGRFVGLPVRVYC